MEVKKIVEGMTAPQVAQVIDDNFKAQNKILEDDIATQNSVIGVSEYKAFSEAEAVAVGDVRLYDGYLYECVEATTGAFDASKWKKSSFKAETEKKLSELGSKQVMLINVTEYAMPDIRYSLGVVYLPKKITLAVYGKGFYTLTEDIEVSLDGEGLRLLTIVWESKEFKVYNVSSAVPLNMASDEYIVAYIHSTFADINSKMYKFDGEIIYSTVDAEDVDFANDRRADVFCVKGIATRRDGSLVFNASYISTPYIKVSSLKDGDVIHCHFNSSIGIQLYDASYSLIGEYPNDFTVHQKLTYDSSLLPSGTVYLRCCRFINNKEARVGNINVNTVDVIGSSNCGYVSPNSEAYDYLARGIKLLSINEDLSQYDEVCINRVPSLSEVESGSSDFIVACWKDGSKARTINMYTRNGVFENGIFTYNDGRYEVVIDYNWLGNIDRVIMSANELRLTRKCYQNKDLIPYVYTDNTNLTSIAKGFRNFKLKRNYEDITIQRVPATADALMDDSTESVVFYVWDGDKVLSRITKKIEDAEVKDGVISFEGSDFDFVVDYNVIGEISRKASSTRQDLTLSSKCFIGAEDLSGYERPDLVGKEYANVSSSTFSSYGWHKKCVENMGMVYSNFGIGGGSHRCYSTTRFNLNFQGNGEPTTDRVILNMVAKLCTEAVVNGYNPDVIASCCVLNDCYKSAIPDGSDVSVKIGNAEDALSIVMPNFDLSSAESIASSFTSFFDSSDPTIVSYRNNSTICNRIALELLSRAFPKACIVVCSCQQVTSDSFNQDAISYFNEQQKKLCQYYAIPYIDINAECGINRVTASTFLKSDLLHPNSNGELVYTNYYTRQINSRLFLKG